MVYQGGEACMSDDGSMTSSVPSAWVAQVLDFWFREVGEEFWFTASSHLDERIRRRFFAVHEQLVESDACGLSDPRSLLAGIVVLDQFSRNMFRGTPRAFGADPVARRLAEQVIALGLDVVMPRIERYLVYLPFEHSEDRGHQALAVRLIEQLGNESWTRHVRAHWLVIDRFGRFPHRNAILGRTSTPDELQFLKERLETF
jgi:uncharacterized protein (DUF924 family)